MAKKRKKRRSWLKALLLILFVPVFVWGAAFLIWLHWYDLMALAGREKAKIKPAATATRSDSPQRTPMKDPGESILEEDRRQLEDIIKRR